MTATVHALCPVAGATRAYLDSSDRAERRAQAIRDAEDSLRAHLLIVIARGTGRVPMVRDDRIESEPIAETVADVLAYPDTMALVMNTLSVSTCPHVSALRARIIDRVVTDRGADIADYS